MNMKVVQGARRIEENPELFVTTRMRIVVHKDAHVSLGPID